jgi:hypothetical protein
MGGYTGGSGAQDVARLRRMVAEPTIATYADADLVAAIERYPVPDPDDFYPDEEGWYATYDLALAAAEIWAEKAGTVAANFDFQADGASFTKSQQYEHYNAQARKWRSLRVPGNWSVQTVPYGTGFAPTESIVGNWNDPYE